MRKLIIAAAAAGLMAIAAPALAGVGGTSETGNEVTCGTGIGVPPGATQVNFGSYGAVVCNDGAPASPTNVIQGRVIVTPTYVAADGDASNSAQAQGWARVNIGASPSVRCGGPADAGTSTDSETNTGTQAACG